MGAKRIRIYTTTYCPYCRLAKEFLRSKGLSFEEVDVTDDEPMRDKLIRLTGQETVPQIFADDVSVGGYEDLVRFYRSGNRL